MSGQSAVLANLHWTEKYRPQSLDDVALEPETRQVLDAYLAAGEIPHMLFIGPPGSGKTTVARIVMNHLDCVTLTLNASSERGIDTVRGKIGTFVTAMSLARWNIVLLDESDAMTADAQTALRNLIESYSDQTRFILTANYGHRVIGPIQSRCQVLTLGRPPLKERYRILNRVLTAEGITFTPQVALKYADKYPDLRRMLHQTQRNYLAAGSTGTLPELNESTGDTTGTQLFTWLIEKNWTAFRRCTTAGDFDVAQGLRELFWAVPDEHARAGFIRHKVGRGVHEMGFTPDPIVLFLGVISEVMEEL